MIFPIDSSTLEALYREGHLTAEGLTAIAPKDWLTAHHPELVETANIGDRPQPKQLTCRDCIHYSSVHQCCNTRIDDECTYLPATESTPACQDFEGINLPPFLKTGGDR